MNQQEICQELTYCGLGRMTGRSASTQEFEAYGDGKLNVVHVLPSGLTLMLDHEKETLWEGYPEDGEQLDELTSQFGHYAAC